MKRLVMVANQFPKFSETFIVTKFLQLQDRGWDVHVVCRRSEPAQWSLFPQLQARRDLHDRIHVADRIDRMLTDLRPDLVHFEFGIHALGQMHVKETLGCRIVVSFRGTDLHTHRLDDPACYQAVWDSADAIHVLSRDLWARARHRGCPPEMPFALIPPSVDVAALAPAQPRHTAAAGTADRPLRIAAVGRLAWIKGYGYGLQAVRLLEDRGVACDFRIIGEGEARGEIVFTVDDLRLEGSVRLLGMQPRDRVLECLRWADVFLHPALCEGFCNAVLEAQAVSLPVVCTDGGALPENVLDSITGFVVPRRDPAALAEKLALLAAEPRRRQRLGEAGRERVASAFGAERQTRGFEALYERVFSLPPSPTRARTSRAASSPPSLEASPVELSGSRPVQEHDGAGEGDPLVRAIRHDLAGRLPPRARIAVVSRGDDELLVLGGLHTCHFPQLDDGTYAGFYPATGAEAVEQLESLRRKGVDYLLLPRPAWWWLDHYVDLREHLERRCRRLPVESSSFQLFEIRTPVVAASPGDRDASGGFAGASDSEAWLSCGRAGRA